MMQRELSVDEVVKNRSFKVSTVNALKFRALVACQKGLDTGQNNLRLPLKKSDQGNFYSFFSQKSHLIGSMGQGSHRLEKYLNLEGFLEKSLKIKSALKSTGKSLKDFEKSFNSTFSVGLALLIET